MKAPIRSGLFHRVTEVVSAAGTYCSGFAFSIALFDGSKPAAASGLHCCRQWPVRDGAAASEERHVPRFGSPLRKGRRFFWRPRAQSQGIEEKSQINKFRCKVRAGAGKSPRASAQGTIAARGIRTGRPSTPAPPPRLKAVRSSERPRDSCSAACFFSSATMTEIVQHRSGANSSF